MITHGLRREMSGPLSTRGPSPASKARDDAERDDLLKDRPDLTDEDPELAAVLKNMPLDKLRLVVRLVPRGQSPRERQEMRRRMGLPSTKPAVRREGRVATFSAAITANEATLIANRHRRTL